MDFGRNITCVKMREVRSAHQLEAIDCQKVVSAGFVDDSEKHRLYYEFMDFIQTVDNNNYAHMEELLEASTVVSKVMYDARKKAGIVFDNDLNI